MTTSLPRRVLVIDDNIDLTNMFAMLLEANGYVTRTAYSGHEGLEAVRDFMPDVVICDIGMPDISGHDVATRIRDGGYGCKPMLIAVSGWGDARTLAASSAAGFAVHMTKPVAIDAVLEAMRDQRPPA
ncbi:response regulator [Massilia timonae]|uniref:Response regulator n=1 Tax=Massilia timonae TaxID=47229 RepID=A0A1S2N5V2_9BURK|nr:response regulator [Massilia timonae]OIJ40467.1 response regulator [Massilia timonae]